jgi:hypothetical protein
VPADFVHALRAEVPRRLATQIESATRSRNGDR